MRMFLIALCGRGVKVNMGVPQERKNEQGIHGIFILMEHDTSIRNNELGKQRHKLNFKV